MQVMPDGDGQLLLLGHLIGRQDPPHAGRIRGHRLLHEHMLAGCDGGFEMPPKAGRRAEQDQIDAAGNRLLVGVEADERRSSARRPDP